MRPVLVISNNRINNSEKVVVVCITDNLKQYLDRNSQDHQTFDRKAERNQTTLYSGIKKVYCIEDFNLIAIHHNVCSKSYLIFF